MYGGTPHHLVCKLGWLSGVDQPRTVAPSESSAISNAYLSQVQVRGHPLEALCALGFHREGEVHNRAVQELHVDNEGALADAVALVATLLEVEQLGHL